MRTISRLLAGGLLLGTTLAACSPPGGAANAPPLEAAPASLLADSLRAALSDRFKPPVEARYGLFADPATGDSIPGFVVRVSAPFEMVAEDTLPCEWLRLRFRARGWSVEAEADGPDGTSYRAYSGRRAVIVQAAWEDLQEPAEVLDWYSLTLGIASSAPADSSSSR